MTDQIEAHRRNLKAAGRNPVKELFRARQRFRFHDRSYRQRLYRELAVTYAAHESIFDQAEKWSDFVEKARKITTRKIPDSPPGFSLSLRCVVEYVFADKHSLNRAYKFARALETLHAKGVKADEVADSLERGGIDKLCYEKSEDSPADLEGNLDGCLTPAVDNRTQKSAAVDNEPFSTYADDFDDADELEIEYGDDDDGAKRTAAEGHSDRSSFRTKKFDPDRMLLVEMEPELLSQVLELEQSDQAALLIECDDAKPGWRTITGKRVELR